MENVIAFNNELSGLYESKPPISKAKMAAITKAAMRAIKFYKHVVQSVEKFILKCKPEYKVPGLYVIDSIVRQSRHQFGVEKDVFAPRFARNMKDTFANLFRCAPDDKSRIIRVLNLWQKNNVFAPDVIQPIFDLADPSHPIYQMPPQQNSGSLDISATSNGLNVSNSGMDVSGVGGGGGSQSAGDDKLVLPDLSNNNLKQLLKDPNVLRQLQTLQNFQKFKQQEEKQHKLNELRMQEEAFEKHIQNVLKSSSGNEAADISGKEVEFVSEESKIEVINLDGNDSRSPSPDRDRYKRRRSRSRSRDNRGGPARGGDIRRRRSRSRSSRSRSPRTNRRRPSRERDRERERLAERNRDKEKEKEREHERERRRKGLPDIKKEHLSVCSTTLWVGHLSKLVYQEELSDTFGKYGDIVSIDQIVPRGCAFIVMNRRQDASKAMSSLKNYKLQGRAITISWAAGKGVKSKEWKDFWDLELGVTYIPWDKLEKDTDLDALEEGGIIDEDSMPDWMKEKINKLKNAKEINAAGSASAMMFGIDGMPKIDITQPPPQAGGMMAMPPFSMAPPMGAPPMGAPPMGAPPRMMTPMGVPMPGNMVPGIPMPQGMVPGMPPPHPMMMTPGMLPPPGYPPMPLDKNIPPPNMRPDGGMQAQFPGMMQPMPIPTPHQFPSSSGGNASSDDQMDIEMEDDMPNDNPQHAPPMNFNQPPPMFQGGGGGGPGGFPEGGPPPGSDGGDDYGGRDRNRGNNSRWGSREDRDQNRDRGNRGGDQSDGEMWRENGPPMGDQQNFNDSRRGGGPPGNMPPFDMNNHPRGQEFFDMRHGGGPDDFNDRRGGGGNRGGGDFFPNMQNNRFNQPNSLMQMRIQPPAMFNNNRMNGPGMGSGPGMFMRGQGPRSQGGPQGGGGGGFGFNNRNPFDRDARDVDGGNRMRGGRGMNDRRGGGRGGGPGGRGGPNNWRDNDEEDDGGIFKRRGGNRFGGSRDRDGPDENRMSRDRDRAGGRRQMNDRNSRDRFDRSSREKRDGGNDRFSKNRRMSSENRDERQSPSKQGGGGAAAKKDNDPKSKAVNVPLDTEEDWDQELSEHDFDNSAKSSDNQRDEPEAQIQNSNTSPRRENERIEESSHDDGKEEDFAAPLPTAREELPSKKIERMNSVNTPLYDEPAAAAESKSFNSDKCVESNNDVPQGREENIAVAAEQQPPTHEPQQPEPSVETPAAE
ncbi:SR-related and CTD-associated factor 4 isoform X2 [Episyrphus balteatus]|uniref:SR-related and CTD-associated factor 4 isoform X2 n=1 Tax=Episyrphus balteatus TaxID=286459 RepID=UPI002486B203|nr:SR-related and CTD-associated factor 4 isoform X2 [Episyrphus balteatus]